MTNATPAKTCPHCTKNIARTRVTCGSEACRGAESAAWLERRRLAREARPRPTTRTIFTKAFRVAIHERDEWTCYLCETPIDPDALYPDIEAAVVDHVVPLHQGGTNDATNLRSAHSFCNLSKGRRALADVI